MNDKTEVKKTGNMHCRWNCYQDFEISGGGKFPLVSMLQGSQLGSTWRNPKSSFPQGSVDTGAIFPEAIYV